MTKTELIRKVAKNSGLSLQDAEKSVNATINAITTSVADGEKVSLVGFGTFERRERSARTGKNPRTGETVEIPAAQVPAFKAGKSFKDACAK